MSVVIHRNYWGGVWRDRFVSGWHKWMFLDLKCDNCLRYRSCEWCCFLWSSSIFASSRLLIDVIVSTKRAGEDWRANNFNQEGCKSFFFYHDRRNTTTRNFNFIDFISSVRVSDPVVMGSTFQFYSSVRELLNVERSLVMRAYVEMSKLLEWPINWLTRPEVGLGFESEATDATWVWVVCVFRHHLVMYARLYHSDPLEPKLRRIMDSQS